MSRQGNRTSRKWLRKCLLVVPKGKASEVSDWLYAVLCQEYRVVRTDFIRSAKDWPHRYPIVILQVTGRCLRVPDAFYVNTPVDGRSYRYAWFSLPNELPEVPEGATSLGRDSIIRRVLEEVRKRFPDSAALTYGRTRHSELSVDDTIWVYPEPFIEGDLCRELKRTAEDKVGVLNDDEAGVPIDIGVGALSFDEV